MRRYLEMAGHGSEAAVIFDVTVAKDTSHVETPAPHLRSSKKYYFGLACRLYFLFKLRPTEPFYF
jgi:hypothetical protein